MTSKKLQRARDFEKKYSPYVAEELPKFHVTGGIGWINDPNGFAPYKGEYHLFYQYYPYDTKWGPMHWGHVKTKDFVRWERLPQPMQELETEAGMIQASAFFMESYRRTGRTPGLPTGLVYGRDDFLAGRLAEAGLFGPAGEETPPERLWEAPAGLHAVYAHRGSWDEQIACWRTLPDLLRAQGLRPAGPVRMLEMGSYALTGNSMECVMHCHIPIAS